jgi:hypothetical protein
MICDYVLNKDVCQIHRYPSLMVQYKLSELSKAISDYYDSVVGFLSHWIGR